MTGFEERTEHFDVDTTGAPVITECPATGCEDLDLWTMDAAGGETLIVVCGAGHLAFISRKRES